MDNTSFKIILAAPKPFELSLSSFRKYILISNGVFYDSNYNLSALAIFLGLSLELLEYSYSSVIGSFYGF